MTDKGIVLFDIDRTIFDTDKQSKLFYKNLLEVLETKNLERVEQTKNDYKRTLSDDREYLPDDYLKLLCKRFKFKDYQALLDVYYGKAYEFIYRESVFPETQIVLDKLKGEFRLGVFSEGAEKFQNHKFLAMGLNDYFGKDLIFINSEKDTKEIVNKIPQKAIIVDDKERICEFLTQHGVRAIWLNKKDNSKSSKFSTIHSLLELPQILL